MIAIKKITWTDVSEEVQEKNPRLALEINKISPDKHYPLYKIKYQYGDELIRNGKFQIPFEDQLLAINDPKLDPEFQTLLGYNLLSNPVCCVLNGSIELFIEQDDRTIPFQIFEPGRLFGLWRIFDSEQSHCPVFTWGMTAGAKHIFLLPKISNDLLHKKINHAFKTAIEKPKHYSEHWHTFKSLSQLHSDQQWELEILAFTKPWFDNLHDPAWKDFHLYLLNQVVKGGSFWRNQFLWNLTFKQIQVLNKLKINPYISDLIRHIFIVSVGVVPGFAPAMNNNLAPIELIQSIYLDLYQLQYTPILMQPQYFNFSDAESSPVFLSAQYPTAIDLAPRTSTRLNAIEDLEALHKNIEIYLEEIRKNRLNLENTPLAQLPYTVDIDYFHSLVQDHIHIKNSKTLFTQNQSLKTLSTQFSEHTAPCDSSFFRGCIRIAHTEKI